MVRAAIRALQRGYGEAQTDPESAVATMVAESRSSTRRSWPRSSTPSRPRSPPARARTASCGRAVLEEWADWDVEFGILDERPDVGAAFDTSLVGPAGRD